MEWFIDDPKRGQTALAVVVLAITIGVIWVGRRKLVVTVPAALTFLLLAAIAIPSAIPARSAAQRSACIQNLKMIQDAKLQWAAANNKLAVPSLRQTIFTARTETPGPSVIAPTVREAARTPSDPLDRIQLAASQAKDTD